MYMKKRICVIIVLMFISINLTFASGYRTLKMYDLFGRTVDVFVKIESIEEIFEFDTREMFNEIKGYSQERTIDITPFIKSEEEVEDDLPF